MLFRQLFDRDTWTYTYLIADPQSGDAIIIDPVREQVERDLALINELSLTLRYAFDTHVHADHVTGSGILRDSTDCQTGISIHADVGCSDIPLKEGDTFEFGRYALKVIETPGHTNTCLSFLTDDTVFSGDSLLIRGCGRTDFQGGDAITMYHSVKNKLFTLPDNMRLFPGHDYQGRTMSTIGEEKAHNPRLRLSETEFVQFMKTLDLPAPDRIQEALPANLACGELID